ncbi:hypothetical protein HHI36_002341 [Cryptolaemus montrouzieri]|uniref:Uncharacterized protein n=1 Tax=Cryptolaemus montrouzieri TaxID=559131 RepID=A0ABD2PA74_9CUCU
MKKKGTTANRRTYFESLKIKNILESNAELKIAATRLKPGASGPDQVPPKIASMMVDAHPKLVLGVMNLHWQNGEFPDCWKKAILIGTSKWGNIQAVSDKARRAMMALRRILPKTGGCSDKARRILMGMAESIFLCATPVWTKALDISKYETVANKDTTANGSSCFQRIPHNRKRLLHRAGWRNPNRYLGKGAGTKHREITGRKSTEQNSLDHQHPTKMESRGTKTLDQTPHHQ